MRTALCLSIGLGASVLSVAQSQLGTVTSSAPFQLRGATVNPGQGVPSWPAMAGDSIKAGPALTIVTFTDGSVVTLEPDSAATLSLSANLTPVFGLSKGTANYSLKTLTAVKLVAGSSTVTPNALRGSFKVGHQQTKGGFWTPTHTALVVGGVAAGTAAGLGVGAANSSGTPVSPSH
jgi:hypothetical protein